MLKAPIAGRVTRRSTLKQIGMGFVATAIPASAGLVTGPAHASAQADPSGAAVRTPPPGAARNVVLVHGAWADGSSWAPVIERLFAAGLRVTAVQNPLTSLADDVAATLRAVARQDGPVVLVGHSWGGAVISEAGVAEAVRSLVYVAARAPDAGEDFAALTARYPTMPARAGIEEREGFAQLSEAAFVAHFASDIDPARARLLYATQQPITTSLFSGRTTVAAWRTKPCWYAVSTKDQTTSPDLQRFLARRMGARTREMAAGHLPMISRPGEIAAMIVEAAQTSAMPPLPFNGAG